MGKFWARTGELYHSHHVHHQPRSCSMAQSIADRNYLGVIVMCYRRLYLSLAISTLLIMVPLITGCSESSGAEVTGTVRFNGQPLSGGKVTFFHPSKPGRNVSCYVQADGSYRILEVPSGEVKVTVVALPPRQKNRADKKQAGKKQYVPPIPMKYTDPETTDIVCPVRGGTQTFDIDLKL